MSDKIVNVYVGECFQEGAQVGGEGKTYGLSLTGNKLKLVENGQQSEVDLPASGGGGSAELPKEVHDNIEELKINVTRLNKYLRHLYVLENLFPRPDEVYLNGAGGFVYIDGEGDASSPYSLVVEGFTNINHTIGLFLSTFSSFISGNGKTFTESKLFKDLLSEDVVFYYGDKPVNYTARDTKLDLSNVPVGTYGLRLQFP